MIMSAPFSRAHGLRQTTVYSGPRSRRCYAIIMHGIEIRGFTKEREWQACRAEPQQMRGGIVAPTPTHVVRPGHSDVDPKIVGFSLLHSDLVAVGCDSTETWGVIAWVELTGLLPPEQKVNDESVLDGIAYDAQHDRLFVTG